MHFSQQILSLNKIGRNRLGLSLCSWTSADMYCRVVNVWIDIGVAFCLARVGEIPCNVAIYDTSTQL